MMRAPPLTTQDWSPSGEAVPARRQHHDAIEAALPSKRQDEVEICSLGVSASMTSRRKDCTMRAGPAAALPSEISLLHYGSLC